MATCRAAGIQFVEIPVAFDGLTVVVHPSNPMRSITVAQLRQIWAPGSGVNNFSAVGGPNLEMQLYGPGSASGTFEYFTEAVNGTARSSRTDYTPSEDDNVLVQGVANNPGGMGYFGLAYYEENRKPPAARWRSTTATARSRRAVQTVENGTYAPLSRPIFIYVNAAALRRPQVQQFVQYYINNAARVFGASRLHPAAGGGLRDLPAARASAASRAPPSAAARRSAPALKKCWLVRWS